MLAYIYGQKLHLPEPAMLDLLRTADMFAVDELCRACAMQLAKPLTHENVLRLLMCGSTYNIAELKQSALDFIVSHGVNVAESADFDAVSKPLLTELVAA